MKKRLTALVLASVLTLTPALAAVTDYQVADKFPAVAEYPGYPDVEENDWFYENARLCYEVGLMTGTEAGFEPDKTLSEEETAALAARLRAALTGQAIPTLQDGDPWYQPYLYFLGGLELNITPGVPATRARFLTLLGAVLPDYVLTPINAIAALPDTADVTALRFYKAGVLTGVDEYGTFAGERTLTRAEAAGMLSRVTRPELRKSFVPADYSSFAAAGMTPETAVFPGVTAGAFLNAVNGAIYNYEVSLRRAGVEFNWHYVDVDGKTVLDGVKEQTLSNLGVSAEAGTEAYRDFDYQVYYSRLIDLMGGPLGAEEAPGAGA